jgi:hypothetical protein
MSLVRLLEIGRSLNAIKDTPSRYCMQRQNLLPKFGPGSATEFHSVAANAPTNSTGISHPLRSPAVLGVSDGEEAGFKWRQASRIFSGPLERVIGFFGKMLTPFKGLAITTSAFRFMGRQQPTSIASDSGRFKGQFQTELSLDNVTVIRNDLSDADLQVVQAQKANKSTVSNQPAQLTAPRGRANTYWERVTSRFSRVPFGYQDEIGFRQVVTPAKKEGAWPSLW